jgi:hypothetical protein
VAGFVIPARGVNRIRLSNPSRVQSSQPVAAIESVEANGRLAFARPESISNVRNSFVFPYGVAGSGYSSWLTLINPTSTTATVTVSFGGASQTTTVGANSSQQLSVAALLQLPTASVVTGALRVTSNGNLLAAMDITSALTSVALSAAPAATVTTFPYVVTGNGMFTGLAFATGNASTTITIEIYAPSGGSPKSTTLSLGPNQQIAGLVDDFVAGLSNQVGGYVRIVSDQPIWSVEMIGSEQSLAVVPPL